MALHMRVEFPKADARPALNDNSREELTRENSDLVCNIPARAVKITTSV